MFAKLWPLSLLMLDINAKSIEQIFGGTFLEPREEDTRALRLFEIVLPTNKISELVAARKKMIMVIITHNAASSGKNKKVNSAINLILWNTLDLYYAISEYEKMLKSKIVDRVSGSRFVALPESPQFFWSIAGSFLADDNVARASQRNAVGPKSGVWLESVCVKLCLAQAAYLLAKGIMTRSVDDKNNAEPLPPTLQGYESWLIVALKHSFNVKEYLSVKWRAKVMRFRVTSAVPFGVLPVYAWAMIRFKVIVVFIFTESLRAKTNSEWIDMKDDTLAREFSKVELAPSGELVVTCRAWNNHATCARDVSD